MNCRKCSLLILAEKQIFREGPCADICGACQMFGLAFFVEMPDEADTALEIHEGEQAGAAMRDVAAWIEEKTMDVVADKFMAEYDAGQHPLSAEDHAAIERIGAELRDKLRARP